MSKNIVLTGIMGSGKTAIGKILARIIGYEFVDIDQYIEKNTNMTIPQLFENGEEYFRDIEQATIEELSRQSDLIISTGGGAILRSKNTDCLKKNGIIFFINRPIKTIVETIDTSHRPLLSNGSEILYSIFENRYPIYKSTCDFEIINDKDIEDIIREIIEKYKSLNVK